MSQRILVFENDANFANEVKTSFERLGASVQVAADGPSGLELAAGNRPDLILLTIELPGMNGFLVCKKIKKTVELENVPLVILSSEVDEETFEQHKKLRTRADDYIRKPIEFAELLQRVKPLVPINGNGVSSLPAPIEEHEDAIAIADDDELIVLGDEEPALVDATADTDVNEVPDELTPPPTQLSMQPAQSTQSTQSIRRISEPPAAEPRPTPEPRPVPNSTEPPSAEYARVST